MKNQLLKNLINKLMFKKMNIEEYNSLESELSNLNNDELSDILGQVWDEYDEPIPLRQDFESLTDKVNVQNSVINKKSKARKVILGEWHKIAAAILLPLVLTLSFYLATNKTITQFTVMADSGQKTHILLPDSTEVWLNSGSRLVYFSDFNVDNRKVQLEGEGYFKVRKVDKQKFIVKTHHIDVIVYGTTFNISAYDAQPTIEVSLESGKINVENNLKNIFLTEMEPNQQFSISKNNMNWELTDIDASLSGIWHTNMMRFSDASPQEVFQKMEKWYGVNIRVEEADYHIRYGFAIKRESLKEMLDLINRITPITYRIDGEEVYVKYK